jgi:hypothetical protein
LVLLQSATRQLMVSWDWTFASLRKIPEHWSSPFCSTVQCGESDCRLLIMIIMSLLVRVMVRGPLRASKAGSKIVSARSFQVGHSPGFLPQYKSLLIAFVLYAAVHCADASPRIRVSSQSPSIFFPAITSYRRVNTSILARENKGRKECK